MLSAVFLLAFISAVAGVSPVFDSASTTPSNWFTGDNPAFSATVSDSDAGGSANNGTFQNEELYHGSINDFLGYKTRNGDTGITLGAENNGDQYIDITGVNGSVNPNETWGFSAKIECNNASDRTNIAAQGGSERLLRDFYTCRESKFWWEDEQGSAHPNSGYGNNWEDNEVHRVGYFYDGQEGHVIVDGQEVQTQNIGDVDPAAIYDFQIGFGYEDELDGTIYNFYVWSDPGFTEEEIKDLHRRNSFPSKRPDLAYRFESGDNSTSYESHHRLSHTDSSVQDGGVSFDGEDDWIEIPNSQGSDLDISRDLTVFSRFRSATDTGYRRVLGRQRGYDSVSLFFQDGNPAYQLETANDGFLSMSGSADLFDGQTHTGTLVHDYNDYAVGYYDGNQFDNFSVSGELQNSESRWFIGKRSDNQQYWNGTVYSSCIWDRTLSSSEVSKVKSEGCMSVQDGLVASYQFENATQRPESRQKNVLDYSIVPSVKLDVVEDGQQIVNDAYLQARDWFTPFDGNTYSVSDAFSVDEWNVWYNASLTATDNQGETQTTEFNQVSEDDTPPTSSDNYTKTGWQSSTVVVGLDASDSPGSGVSNLSYRLTGGDFTTVKSSSTTITIDNLNGNIDLEYFAVDEARNNESINTQTIKRDTINPSLSNDYSNTGWFSKPFISVNYTASDSVSNIANTSFRKNQNPFTTSQSSSFTVNVTQEGNTTIDAEATDLAGNTKSTTQYVALDTGKPVYRNFTSSSDSTWIEWKDSTSPVSEVLFAFNESGQFRNQTWYDYAHYNASIGAPVCRTNKGGSCVAPSSLVKSRDDFGPGEPNSPNTIDSATDGTKTNLGYTSEESVENITVRSLDGNEIEPGDQIELTYWYYCYGSSDIVNIAYTDNISPVSWAIEDSRSCEGRGLHSNSITLGLSQYNGSHAIRVLVEYNGGSTNTEQDSGYGDQDDIVLDFESDPVTANKVNVTSNPIGSSAGSFYNFSVDTSFDPVYSKVYGKDSAGNWDSTGLLKGNVPPDIPVLNNPLDGESVQEEVNLSIDVSDPDAEPLDVTFYWSNGSKIGSVNDVDTGTTVSTTVSGLDYGKTYNWYAEVSDGTASTNSSTYSFDYKDSTVPASRNLNSNVTGTTPRNSSVNISAEFIDGESGLERAVLSTNETGEWMNWTGVNFNDGFEDGDYTSDPAWSDESTGGSTSIVSDGAGGSSQALKLSDEGRFSGYSNYPELVHRREMKLSKATKFTFYVQMNNLGSDPIAQPDSRVKLGSEDGSYSLNIDTYSAQFDSNVGEQTKYHTLNEGDYYKAEITFYRSNDTASNKLFDNTGNLVLGERLNYSGVETFQNITVNTNAGQGYSYDFKVDEFKFINGDYDSPIYLGGAADSWEPTSFEWGNSSFSGELGYRIWAKDSSGNWNRTEIQSFTVNTAPVFQDAELQWTGMGSQSESRVLEYSINDPDGTEISSRNNPPSGSVSVFSNSTYRVTGVPKIFDYSALITDFTGASTSLSTNYTLNSTGFRESGFRHDLGRQRINNTVEVENRGEPLSVNVSVDGEGILTSTDRFSGELTDNDSTQLTAEYESDYITGENKTQEELGQNLSKASTVDTQYLFNQTGLEVYNTRSFSFSGVDLSSKCSITQTSDIPSGSSKVTTSCSNDSLSGDWIKNEKNYSTEYVSGTPVFGSGVDKKFNASQKVEATNVRTDLNLTVELSGLLSKSSYCSSLNSTEQEIGKDRVESFTFRKSCSAGEETGYTPVQKTETSDSYKYHYQSTIKVFSNLTENQSLKHAIPENRLDNFGSREPGETTVSVDGNSNDLSIQDTRLIGGTEYVVLKIGDQHGNSSLHEGSHNVSLTYYESKTPGSTSGGGSTGSSGTLLVSSGSETTVDENNGSKFSWMVSAITSEDTKSFQISGYPGDSFQQFVVLRNTGDRNVSLDIDCVSQDNSCQYVDTDVDRVVLNRNSFTEKNVKVTGELPENFSEEDAPAQFSIRVTDPAWNSSSTSGESVSYVDFTVTYDPISGRVLDLIYKAGEGFTIESPVDWGNNVTVPFILVPLVLSVLVAGLVALVEWLAPFSSNWESQRKLVEVLVVSLVFVILYGVIPAGG